LAIREKVFGPDHETTATSLNSLASLYQAMGEYGRAVPLAERSLAIKYKTLGPDHVETAVTLNNLGLLYQTLGQNQKALVLLEQAAAIRERNLGARHVDTAASLHNLGRLYHAMGNYDAALPLYERALRIRTEVFGDNHADTALSRSNLALLYRSTGQHEKALPLYRAALAAYERTLGGTHPRTATAINNLAELYSLLGRRAEAGDLLRRAWLIAAESGSPETMFAVVRNLAYLHRGDGNTDLAVLFGKQAINVMQGLRTRSAGLEQELQRALIARNEAIYKELAEWLIDQGRLPEAQQVLAMLKEEEYFEFITRDASQDPRSTQAGYTPAEESWQRRYREISGRLGEIGKALEELDGKARLGLTDEEKVTRERLRADRRVAQQAFESFLGELMRELGTASAERNREIGERNLVGLRTLQDTLASLGQGAVVLHYVMGESKLRVILTTPSIQIARESPIASSELNRKIQQFHSALSRPGSNPLPLAQELYKHLIAPVAADLKQARAQTLMVSLDGALRYIPLSALHDGSRYLVEDYRIAIYTEAARDRLRDRPQDAWRVAGLGLTRQVADFSALPGVRQEIEGIVKAGGRGVLPGEAHFDEQFTALRLHDALDKGYPVLHIASHFEFQPGTQANSYLVLGDGSRLTLQSIKDDDYRFRDVDLITLSACETAIGGGRDANGLEIEGFGALAQKQGARGVIATLWRVADQSTGLLMQDFYRLREAEKLTKAEALRQAQLALLRGQVTGSSGIQRGAARTDATSAQAAIKPVYAHPYFWAPFILMGNWL
jgi:CHAT domain-containing protein/tetratricopeptide (TPR) repeat protein